MDINFKLKGQVKNNLTNNLQIKYNNNFANKQNNTNFYVNSGVRVSELNKLSKSIYK